MADRDRIKLPPGRQFFILTVARRELFFVFVIMRACSGIELRTHWMIAAVDFESGTSGGPFHYRNNSAHRMCFLQSYLASSAVLVPAPEPRPRFFYWRKGVALNDYRNEIIRRRIVYQTLARTPRTGEGNRKNRPETRQFRDGCTNEMKRRLLCQKWVSTKRKNGPSS